MSQLYLVNLPSTKMKSGNWKSKGGGRWHGKEGVVGGGASAVCCYQGEFNKTTHAVSHLHVRKGPVIVADVEQADSLWKQPAKDKKEHG